MSDVRVDYAQKFRSLVQAFDDAEEALKSAELADERLSVVPINQLRYGFKHLTQAFRAIECEDVAAFEVNLRKSEGHCKRAFYDARDVELSYHISKIQNFIESSQDKKVRLSTLIPNYSDWVSVISETKRFLEKSQILIPDKDERYRKIAAYLDRAKNISSQLPGAAEVVNESLAVLDGLQEKVQIARAESRDADERAKAADLVAQRSLKTANVTLFVAVVGIVVAVLVAVVVVVFDEPLKAWGRPFINSFSDSASGKK
jgi:hypothetical protein